MSNDIYKQLLNPSSAINQQLVDNMKKAVEEKTAVKTMEIELHTAQVKAKYADLKKRQEDKEASEKFSLDITDSKYYKDLAISNSEYFYYVKQSGKFLGKEFEGFVPYFANNLILIGAKSGSGKSTLTANFALDAYDQGKNVLIITNEEVVSDCYNRITCLQNHWSYTNHGTFTSEQIKTFNSNYEKLGEKIRIIADHHNGRGGLTTTLEGITYILESLHKTSVQYDVIIIDYFQNISQSLDHPYKKEWEILDKLTQYLDQFRKVYKAPIILLSQINQDDDAPFKERIERCKSIYNRATCAIEVNAIYDQLATDFTIHKSRFSQGIGKKIIMGFDKGRYVDRSAQIKQMEDNNHKKLVTK